MFKNKFLLNAVVLMAALIIVSGCGGAKKKKVGKQKERADIYYKLGVEFLKGGQTIDALENLIKAIEYFPNEPDYNYVLGVTYHTKEMYHKAIEHLDIAIANKEKFSQAYTSLSEVYIDLKSWDKVIVNSKMALDNIFYRKPERALTNIGIAYYNKAEFERALGYLKKAVKANHRHVMAYNQMGLTYERLSSAKDAQYAYERAVKYAPNYLEANYNFAVFLVKLRKKTEAIVLFEKIVKLAPESNLAKSSREYLDLLK